jgi:hypothetical protein
MPSKRLPILCAASILLLLLCVLVNTSRISATPPLDNSFVYDFDMVRTTNEGTSHCTGEETITLGFSMEGVTGRVTYRYTWDEGESWTTIEEEYTYSEDRTYLYLTETLYTGWWIDTLLQEGSLVYIDGDMPATNQFSRTGPFIVHEMLGITVGGTEYICWRLTYNSPANGQSEAFYYETRTGILVAAYADLYQPNLEKHMTIEIQPTENPLPKADPLTLLWVSYGSVTLSIAASSVATLGAFYLLRVTRRRRTKRFTQLLEKR